MRARIVIAAVASLAAVLGVGRPAWAQIASMGAGAEPDISGTWVPINHEDGSARGPGPEPLDWTGLALNDEGRALALSASVSRDWAIERACAMYPPQYLVLGPFGMKIWPELDPRTGSTIAYHIGAWEDRMATVIWLDGRPHPSENAPHTRAGFETGQWRGNTLTTHTTHIKSGIIRRNGARVSDQATLTTHYVLHDDLLTVLVFIDDPIYLSEPEAISKDFHLNRSNVVAATGPPCIAVFEGSESDTVPHYLPGTNPLTGELQKTFGIPSEAALGGAETMYPEYRNKIKAAYVRPAKCLRNCGIATTPLPPAGAGPPGGGALAPQSAPAPGTPPR